MSLKAFLLSLLVLGFCPAALASSMPKADQSRNSISLGTGPSLGLDFIFSPEVSVGLSASTQLNTTNFGMIRYDLRGGYTFLQQAGLSVKGIVGFFGEADPQQRPNLNPSPFGIEAGIALAYQFNSWFTGRLNIVTGINFPRANTNALFPPAGGIELGFRPFENIEASAGYNGHGDILAIRYLF